MTAIRLPGDPLLGMPAFDVDSDLLVCEFCSEQMGEAFTTGDCDGFGHCDSPDCVRQCQGCAAAVARGEADQDDIDAMQDAGWWR